MTEDLRTERLLAKLSEAEPYLEDGGFTDRVMARLPPPRRSRRRSPLILGALALGIAIVAGLPATSWLVRSSAVIAATRQVPSISLLVAIAATFGVLLWASLVAARAD